MQTKTQIVCSRKRMLIDDKSKWKRYLWLKQDVPDNYTDERFIKYIDNIKEIKYEYDYDSIRKDFLNFYYIILNKCFVFIIFALMYQYNFTLTRLNLTLNVLLVALTIYRYGTITNEQIKSSVIIIFIILTLSPVLSSLSRTTSTDSIWTISFWLTIYYLFTIFKSMTYQDVITEIRTTNNDTKRVKTMTYSKNISTNILIANVALLSSRLGSTTLVFTFLLICVQINIIIPKLIKLSTPIVSLLSNIIVYTFINVTMGFSNMLLLGILTICFTTFLPRLFWYWEMNYKCKTPEILSLWDTQKLILE